MRVLWFSNIVIEDTISTSGTWIYSMAKALSESNNITLYNITQGNVKNINKIINGNIYQSILPSVKIKNGLPTIEIINEIQRTISEFKPDIIHIWGTENYWGLLYEKGYISGNVLLEIQGLKHIISKHIFRKITIKDFINSLTFKDLLKPSSSSIFGLYKNFKNWEKYEKRILCSMQNISVQSKWVEAHVLSLNPTANIFESKIKLRDEFLFKKKWSVEKFIPYRIFTSASTPFSYKGIHQLIKSFSIIAKKYPSSRLCIAARLSKKGFRQSGYEKLLSKLIKQNKLTNNIIWLGELDAKELVNQLLLANVYVMPSFIESYCLALDEAITIGTPTVSSFTGATPELGIPNVTTLYYSPEDEIECAFKIEQLFEVAFAAKISENSYNYKLSEKNDISYSELQIDTYKKIISNN